MAGRWENLSWEKMAAMAVICITGSSDGIGLATARVLVASGHRVLIHARSQDRGRPVLEQLGGETTLVTGDLAQLDEVHRLADQIHATARSTRSSTTPEYGCAGTRRGRPPMGSRPPSP
jgi:NAD(P)-dependent dehydrogenase (short-subunit alcohol dehydrogenase family)